MSMLMTIVSIPNGSGKTYLTRTARVGGSESLDYLKRLTTASAAELFEVELGELADLKIETETFELRPAKERRAAA